MTVYADQVWRLFEDTAAGSPPLRPAAVDAVVACSVREYADDPAAVLREASRVLHLGGAFVRTIVRSLDGTHMMSGAAAHSGSPA